MAVRLGKEAKPEDVQKVYSILESIKKRDTKEVTQNESERWIKMTSYIEKKLAEGGTLIPFRDETHMKEFPRPVVTMTTKIPKCFGKPNSKYLDTCIDQCRLWQSCIRNKGVT